MAVDLVKFILRAYHITLSPFLGTRCRFYPSCSVYAHESLDKYGLWQGSYKTVMRLLRCQPFHRGGVDLP